MSLKDTRFNQASRSEQQQRKKFATLVKSLRGTRYWNQSDLAKHSGISYKTVGDVERAEKAKLDLVTVTLLADAFQLVGVNRDNFFQTAGLVRQITSTHQLDLQQIEYIVTSFYNSIKLPAFVHDVFFDLHSFNSYIAIVFGINVHEIQETLFDSAGPNILRLLFDPVFDTMQVYGGDVQWERYTEINVYLFWQQSFRYQEHERYQTVLREMKKFPRFAEMWEQLEKLPYIPAPRVKTILYPGTDSEMVFITTNTTFSELMPHGMQMSMYVPADACTTAVFNSSQSSVAYEVYRVDWDEKHIRMIS